MGSCQNLVNVDENSSEPTTEHYMRSESLVLSVSEMAHSDKEFKSAPYVCLDLSGSNNAGNVTSNDITGRCSDSGGLVVEHEGTAVLSLENLVKNECGFFGDCLNENQSEIGNLESHGDCLKGGCDGGVGGSTYLSWDCVMSSLVETMASSSSSSVQQDVQDGNEKLLVEVVKDKGEDLADKKTNLFEKAFSLQSGEISLSGDCQMISKAVALTDSLISCVQQDKQKHNESVHCIPSIGVVAEEKGEVLAQKNTNFCVKGSVQGCEMPSEFELGESKIPLQLVRETGSPKGEVPQDQQKDEESVKCLSSKMAFGIVEDEGDSLAHDKIDLCNKLSPFQGYRNEVLFRDCEMSMEFATMTGSPRHCGQKDNISMDCLSPKVVGEVVEEKDYTFAEESANLCAEISSLQGSEMPLKFKLVNGVLGNTFELKEHNSQSVSIPTISDVSGWLRSDMCNKLSLAQNGEMPIQASNVVKEVSNCGWKNDKRDNKEQHNQVSSACQQMLKIVHMPELPSSLFQQNEQMNGKSVQSCPVERFIESIQDKNDVIDDVKVETMTVMLPLEGSACNLTEGSSRVVAPKIEKLVSFQPCEPLDIVNDGSAKVLDVPHQSGKYLSSIDPSQAFDFSRQWYSDTKDGLRHDSVPETQCCGIVTLSSQRSNRRGKSNCKSWIKKEATKCGNTIKVSCTNEGIDNVLNAARKKRTYPSKQARSSIWGMLGNVSELFRQSNGHEVIQAHSEGSQKQKCSRNNGKKNRSRTAPSAQGYQRKCGSANNCLRLKVKVGKEVSQSCVNIHEAIDLSALAAFARRDYESDMCLEDNFGSPRGADDVVDKLRKCETADLFECFGNDQEKKTSTDLVSDKLAGGERDNFPGVPSHIVVEAPDPGTSPDSEVINLTPDTHVDFKPHQDHRDRALTISSDVAASADLTTNKKAKKKSKLFSTDSCISGSQSPIMVRKNKAKSSNLHGQKKNLRDGLNNIETSALFISLKASSNYSSDKEQSKDPLCFLGETEFAVSVETCNGDSGSEAKVESNLASPNSKDLLPDAIVKGCKISKGKSKVCDSRNKRATERKQWEAQKKSGNKKMTHGKVGCDKNACKLEIQPETGNHTIDGNGKTSSGELVGHVDILKVDMKPGGILEQYFPPCSAWVCCDGCLKWRRITAELADYIEEMKCSWICKDNVDKAFADCGIPQEKSNADINAELEISDASGEEDAPGPRPKHKGLEHRRLTVSQQTVIHINSNQFLHRSRKNQTIDEIMVCHCKPPSDGKLGCGDDCLNRMLNIECVRGACPCEALCSNQQFQKRRYAKLEPFRCGKKGCGLKSLEDISQGHFLIEYVGEVLDMHAYEARQKEYALKGHKHFYFMTLNGSEVIDACVKGNLGRFINHSCDPNCRTEKWMVNGEICIGLFALRDIKKGEEVTFDYNYVSVFGAAAKKCYCGSRRCRGCIGGDPLNSEVVIQSDSDEDHPEPVLIPEGGKIDKLNVMPRSSSSVIHGVDSVLENIDEKGKSTIADGQLGVATGKVNPRNQSMSATSVQKTSDFEDVVGNLPSIQFPETSRQTEDVATTLTSVVGQDIFVEEGPREKASSSIQVLEISSPSKMHISTSSAEDVNGNKKSKLGATDKRISSKSHPRVKTSHSLSSLKKKVKSNAPDPIKVGMATNKASGSSSKPKKLMDGLSHVHFEAVEENLNNLLDADGGISKWNDAPKGYLKLLVLTAAASGDSSNGAIQSNRDLSMILDALLKTKSRTVLTDIINKNGLRMLHNMLKQYRTDFKKRPILRKLLKVLEYLATREILTMEHITGGPPCPGMESFRFSILSLTDHEDKQVHQIARNFRDRWIPRSLRRLSFMDRDDRKSEFHRNSCCNRSPMNNNWHDLDGRPVEAIDRINQCMPATTLGNVSAQESCSAPSIGDCSTSGNTRKRKSRWDQPADPNPNLITLQSKEQNIDSVPLKQFEFSPLPGVREVKVDCLGKGSTEDKNCAGYAHDRCLPNEGNVACDGRQNNLVDVPPGFSFSLPNSLISSVATSTFVRQAFPFDKVIVGYPQEKFVSHLPVSYGIPLSIIQQFGTPNAETLENCVVPGMPFHPFPPLPAFPCDKGDPSPSLAVSHVPGFETSEGHHVSRPLSDESNPSPTGDQRDTCTPSTSNQYKSKREREFSNDLGTRYFKQQKPNNMRSVPPKPWIRNGQPCMNGSRDGTSCMGIGTLTNELSTYSEDISRRSEQAFDSGFEQSEHHNQH